MSEEKNVLNETTGGESTVDKKKKKYIVAGTDAYGLYYLGFENGGELPDKLKGVKYTDHASATAAVLALNEGR